MKITKIEKKKRLYLLELDHTENLYITEDTLVHFMLHKDTILDQSQLENIKIFAQISDAKNRALYYLSFKQRTAKEVKTYLSQKEYDNDIIHTVIQDLQQEKWIDEQRYTESYLRQNLVTSDKGPYVLQQKLSEKGISDTIIQDELEKIDFSELIQKLCQKLVRKYQSKFPQKQLFLKIQQTLVNKGFDYKEIKTHLDNLILDNNEEHEEQLLEKELEKSYRKYSKKYTDYPLKQRLIQAMLRKGFDYDSIKRQVEGYF